MRRLKYLGGGILVGLVLTGLLFGFAPALLETLSGTYEGWRSDRASPQPPPPRKSGEQAPGPQEVEINGRIIQTRSELAPPLPASSRGATESVRINGRTIQTRVQPASEESAGGDENLRRQLRRKRERTHRALPVDPEKVEEYLEKLNAGVNLDSAQNH